MTVTVPPITVDQPVLEAVDLCVGYGAHPVVSNLQLSVAPGEVVAFLVARLETFSR